MTTIPTPNPTHATYVLDPADAPDQSPKPIAILCPRTTATADHKVGRSQSSEVTAPMAGGPAGAAVWCVRIVQAGVAGGAR
jgi:hypothetical protein